MSRTPRPAPLAPRAQIHALPGLRAWILSSEGPRSVHDLEPVHGGISPWGSKPQVDGLTVISAHARTLTRAWMGAGKARTSAGLCMDSHTTKDKSTGGFCPSASFGRDRSFRDAARGRRGRECRSRDTRLSRHLRSLPTRYPNSHSHAAGHASRPPPRGAAFAALPFTPHVPHWRERARPCVVYSLVSCVGGKHGAVPQRCRSSEFAG